MMWPTRASASTMESAYLLLDSDLWMKSGCGMFGWCTFMKLTLMKNGLPALARPVEIVGRRLFHIGIEEWNADDALVGRIHVFAVDLELFASLFAGISGQRALGYLFEHGTQLRWHVWKPVRIGVGVGVEMIEEAVLHFIVALGVGERVVGFAQVPFAGEEGFVAGGFKH